MRIRAAQVARLLPIAGQIALPFALTLALYHPVLKLPYFWDDIQQYQFVTTRSWWQLWSDAGGLPYYRPLTFTWNKLVFEGLPFGATFWPHLLIVLSHLATSLLTGYVAGQFVISPGQAQPGWTRPTAAVIAGLLFSVYPFAPMSVAYFQGANHVLLTLCTVFGVAACLAFARSRHRRWLGLASAAALLAPFVHEAGVMAGTIMAFSLSVYDWPFARRKRWVLALLPLLSALFVPVWLLVPKTRGETGVLPFGTWRDLVYKLSFFGQAPTYPVQPVGTLLMHRLGWPALGTVWAVGLPPLLMLAYGLWKARRTGALLFGLGWIALSVAPSIVVLPVDYIEVSQRLLLYPGPGAVVLWSVALVSLASVPRRRRLSLAAAAAVVTLALGVSAAYSWRQVRLNSLALSPLEQMAAVARQHPTERHLVVNTVNWMAYQRGWYSLGHDGIPVLAPYIDLPHLIYVNTGVHLSIEAATLTDLLPALNNHYLSTANEAPERLWDFGMVASKAGEYDHIWFTAYTDEVATLQDVGHIVATPSVPPERYVGSFEGMVYLLDDVLQAGPQELTLTLDWLYLGPDPAATIFSNAFDCAGDVVGLNSGPALGKMLSFTNLTPGVRIHDIRHIHLDALASDGCYQVEVGLFRADGSRLPVTASDGSAMPNDLILVR